MYNMHIKWKLKTCRIQLWHKKVKFVTIFWEKIKFLKFSPLFWQDFFSKFKIFKIFFIQPPKFIPYTNFKHQKWKLQGGFIIVPLPYWTGRASKQAASWFLPPLVFLGLRKPKNTKGIQRNPKEPWGKLNKFKEPSL